MKVECFELADVDDDDLRAIAELIFKVWPKPEKDVEFRMRQLRQYAADHVGTSQQSPKSFVVRDEQSVLAQSAFLTRVVGTTAGDMMVLGLTKVVSDPDRRGEGLGAAVVRATFDLVDNGIFPFALFQTTPQVRPFYLSLGAREIDNEIIDSLADDPTEPAFRDPVHMCYPDRDDWPSGTIDIRGPQF